MHSIHIGISCNNDIIIAKAFICRLQYSMHAEKIEFFIFINHFFGQAKTVQRLTTQTEHGLSLYFPDFGNGSAGTIAFCDKNGTFLLFLENFFFILSCRFIIVMKATVTQLLVMKIGFLRPFIRQFFNSGNSFLSFSLCSILFFNASAVVGFLCR